MLKQHADAEVVLQYEPISSISRTTRRTRSPFKSLRTTLMRAKEIQPKTLVVFDIDDTLVHTQTKVHVVKDGEVVKSLNSHDFTHYKLQPGESFDFEDFRNAREFFEKSRPIIPMMNQLKRDIARGNKVVMVTARADFDDKELFLDTFRKYGVDIDKVHVYRAGNSKQGTTEERKKAIIKTLLDKDNYSKAIMYDDAKPNLHTFIELKNDHPKTRFYAWHVSLEGEASEYMREGMVSEKRRRRKFRGAAYGPGPFGGYGYATGYSGDGGGAVGEASYAGNIGAMEVFKFMQKAGPEEKEILKQLIARKDYSRAWALIQGLTGVKLQGKEFEDQHPNEQPRGPETKPTMPKGTVKVDVSDVYDWYKLGQHISNMRGLGKHDFGQGPPSTIFSFGDEELEHKYIQALLKTGLTTTDIDPAGHKKRKGQKVDPTYNVENFADGKVKGKSRPGRVKRAGASCDGSVTDLRKRAKNSSGEKAKMYHWCANMKSGRGK